MVSASSLVTIDVEDEEILLIIKKLRTPYYLDYVDLAHVFHLILDNDAQHWYDDIYKYLKDQIVRINYDKNDRIRLKRIPIKYIIIREVFLDLMRVLC